MQRTHPGVPAAASLDDLIGLRRSTSESIGALLPSDGTASAPAEDPAGAAERLYQDWCALTPEDGSGFASEAVTVLLHRLYAIDHAILSLTDGEPI
jgi:hypothetical protein